MKKHLQLDCIALLAGLLLPLAFAPFNLSFFAFLSPVLLLWVASQSKGRRAFYRGYLYGLGQFGFGVSWVYVSMSVYGGFGAHLAFLITVLLILILATFPGVQIYFLQRFFPANTVSKYLLAFPATWALMDYLRTVVATGFPWLLLGYAQINTFLRSLAPLIGIYGLSFVTCYTSAIGLILLSRQNFKLKIIALLSVVLIWAGAALLSPVQWTHPGKVSQVSLIQGNIPQELKWNPKQLPSILKLYRHLTQQHWKSSLIIWPEAAIPSLANELNGYLQALSTQSKKHHTGLLIGAPLFTDGSFYNAIITAGNAEGTYLKHHLVPFGEYLPFKSYLRGLLTWLHIPMSDFSPGLSSEKQDLLLADKIPIAAFICYEIAYPTQVLEATAAGAQLLVVVTDDSWFGRSFAAAQHLQMAQMRALETGKYLLFSANTGITAIIQPDGRLLAVLPPFQRGVLTDKVYAMIGNTPLVYIGNHGVLIFCLGLLIFTCCRLE